MTSEIVIVGGKVLHLGLAKGQLAANIFLVGDPARALRVAKRFDDIQFEVRNREYVTLTGTIQGLPVSVIGTGIGVDNVEIAMVEAYAVRAFDFTSCEKDATTEPLTFIRIGTSAGCQDDIDAGTLAIADYALGLDNAGLYYDHAAVDQRVTEIERQAFGILTAATPEGARFKGKIFPYASKASSAVTAALRSQAERLEAEHVVGITSSTPGFYGPSSRVIDGLRNTIPDIKTELAAIDVDGTKVVNMEMESSLIFHLARHLGAQAGTICPIISKPTAAASIFDYMASVERAIDVGVAAMCELKT